MSADNLYGQAINMLNKMMRSAEMGNNDIEKRKVLWYISKAGHDDNVPVGLLYISYCRDHAKVKYMSPSGKTLDKETYYARDFDEFFTIRSALYKALVDYDWDTYWHTVVYNIEA